MCSSSKTLPNAQWAYFPADNATRQSEWHINHYCNFCSMKNNLLGVLCNAGKPQKQRQTSPLADRMRESTAPAGRIPVVVQVPSIAQQWDHRKGKKIPQLLIINVVRYKNTRISASVHGVKETTVQQQQLNSYNVLKKRRSNGPLSNVYYQFWGQWEIKYVTVELQSQETPYCTRS